MDLGPPAHEGAAVSPPADVDALSVLPDDLLSEIFCHSFRQPYVVAATCRRWRAVALHTPEMWTNVWYSISERKVFPQNRWALCFRTHIERSHALLLHVNIHWRTKHGLVPDLYMAIVALVHRSRTFALKTTSKLAQYNIFENAPHLTHFTLVNLKQGGWRPWTLSLQAPRLTSLAFLGPRLNWDEDQAPFELVRKLTLDVYNLPSNDFTSLFSRLFPNVEHVSLTVHGCVGWEAVPRALHLHTFELVMPAGPSQLSANLITCDFPALRTAYVSFANFPWQYDAISAFMRACLSTVENLELDTGYILRTDPLLDGLRACVNVQHLTLHMVSRIDRRSELIRGLEELDICPQLATLTLHLPDVLASQGSFPLFWETFFQALEGLGKARRSFSLKKIQVIDTAEDSEFETGTLQALHERLEAALAPHK